MRSRLFAAVFLILPAMPLAAQTWTRVHGGADNAGFADVLTSPVDPFTTKLRVMRLGRFAPGSGPVVGTDGTAYLGTLDGELKAITTGGGIRWTRRLAEGVRIIASPMIGSDGSIYVVGVRGPLRDHRGGVTVYRAESWLYRFSAAGAPLWQTPFPGSEGGSGAGVPSAPPNAIGSGAAEVILVPLQVASSFDLRLRPLDAVTRLVAFSSGGRVLLDEPLNFSYGGMSAGGFPSCWTVDCWFGLERPPQTPAQTSDRIPPNASPPLTTIAVAQGDIIVATDGIGGIRGYFYRAGDSLSQRFEKVENARAMTSAISALSSGRTVYAVKTGRIAFSGPSDERVADIGHARDGESLVQASPTRLANGWIVTIDRDGGMTIIENVTPIRRNRLRAQTIAAASASRNYFYVSTASEFVTFNAETLDEAARFPWEGGGLSSPAIGADGRVYALAGDSLYIFKRSAAIAACPSGAAVEKGAMEAVVQGCAAAPPVARLLH